MTWETIYEDDLPDADLKEAFFALLQAMNMRLQRKELLGQDTSPTGEVMYRVSEYGD